MPAWLNNYFGRNYHLIGNCELKPKLYQQNQTYLWSTLPNQVIYNDTREFGIQDGLFVINPCKRYTEFFEFSSLQSKVHMTNVFLNNYEFIQNFKKYFVEHAEKLIKNAEEVKLILPHRKENKLFNIDVSTLAIRTVKLTQQQNNCAIRLLQGKTQKVIAKELGLSPRTVESYLNNLKSKFNVGNTTELIIALARMM